MKLDVNVVDAIGVYFKWGLHPGSFTARLLGAKRSSDDYCTLADLAHPFIRKQVDDYVWFVENCVPLCCRGENFATWEGYEREIKKDPALATIITLALTDTAIARQWIKEIETQEDVRAMVKEFVEQDEGQ